MASAPTPFDAAAPAQPLAAALARAQWRRARLEELTQIGMGLVRGLPRVGDADERMLEAIAVRFARLARAIRLVVFLAGWIGRQVLALMRGESLPDPWRRPRPPRLDAPPAVARPEAARGVGPTDEDEAGDEAGDEVGRERDAPERAERDGAAGVAVERRERITFASWNEAINAICNVFGIEDRDHFLECERAPAPPADLAGGGPADPVARRKAPAPQRPSPWGPGGALTRRAALHASTALPDERMLQ